jgi:hypothetical protein
MKRPKKDAKRIEGVVSGLLQKWQTKTVEKANAVKEAWKAATDKETREHSELISFKKGILTIIVGNSSLLYKLTLEKRNIIEQFNKNYKGRIKAKDIRFRVGTPGAQ